LQSAAKRYKVTGTGKVMGRRAGKQHFNEKKSRDDIRDASKMWVWDVVAQQEDVMLQRATGSL
jgi:ribosomal protein L35